MMPLISAETGEGAAGCASGSHTCSGIIPALAPKPKNASTNATVAHRGWSSAAPSPVSALMSGIMLKTAIYGMIRVIYDLIGNVHWEWGMLVLVIGTGTTLFGVLYALMQHDLKRLLAYHSVENIGIILLGLGMSMVFVGFGHPAAGALGLIAALYHTLNHAVFKGLLFLGAGSILP